MTCADDTRWSTRFSEDLVNRDEIGGLLSTPDSKRSQPHGPAHVDAWAHLATSDILVQQLHPPTSSDKTVRLWPSRQECLVRVQHVSLAIQVPSSRTTSSSVVPGRRSCCGTSRTRRLLLWNEVDGPLDTLRPTCQNGKFAVKLEHPTAGASPPRHGSVEVPLHNPRVARQEPRGRRYQIEPMPGEDKILVTSGRSEPGAVRTATLSLICKYRGYTILTQVNSELAQSGWKVYMCGKREPLRVYCGRAFHPASLPPSRKDRNITRPSPQCRCYVYIVCAGA